MLIQLQTIRLSPPFAQAAISLSFEPEAR